MPLLALLLAAGVLDVPFVPQKKDTCGAAALAMVMRYWGVAASHDEIAGRLGDPELRGIAGSRLEAYARDRGLVAIAHRGDVDHLRRYLARGRPLIVAWDMGGGRFHDVVVIGTDELSGDIVVHDPARGASRRIPVSDFDARWKGAGHWTLLVARPEDGPPAVQDPP